MMTTTQPGRTHGAAHGEPLRHSVERATMRLALRIARCGRGEDGSTLVEMALVLPILLVVLTGVFSFGVALNQYLVLTNAVNNGARAFAMSAPYNSGYSMVSGADPCKYAAQTIQASAGTLDSSKLTYTITYTVNSSSTTTTYTGNGSSLPSCYHLTMTGMDMVIIKAQYPVTPVLFGWASQALSLTSSSAELVQ